MQELVAIFTISGFFGFLALFVFVCLKEHLLFPYFVPSAVLIQEEYRTYDSTQQRSPEINCIIRFNFWFRYRVPGFPFYTSYWRSMDEARQIVENFIEYHNGRQSERPGRIKTYRYTINKAE